MSTSTFHRIGSFLHGLLQRFLICPRLLALAVLALIGLLALRGQLLSLPGKGLGLLCSILSLLLRAIGLLTSLHRLPGTFRFFRSGLSILPSFGFFNGLTSLLAVSFGR